MNKYEQFLKEQLNKELDRAVSKMPAQPPMPEKPAAEKNSRLLTAAACILVLLISGSLFMLMPQIKENRSPIPTATAEYPQVTPRYTQDPLLTPRTTPENTLTPMPSVTPVVTPSPVKASDTQTPVIATSSPQQNVQANATPDPAVISPPVTASPEATAAPAPLLSLIPDYSVSIAEEFYSGVEYNGILYYIGGWSQNLIAMDMSTYKIIAEKFLPGPMNLKIRENKLYLYCDHQIKCYDLKTLDELESLDLLNPSSAFDVYDGYIYYFSHKVLQSGTPTNNEDYSVKLFKQNLATGERSEIQTITMPYISYPMVYISSIHNILVTLQANKLVYYNLDDSSILSIKEYSHEGIDLLYTDDFMYSGNLKISYNGTNTAVDIHGDNYHNNAKALFVKDNILIESDGIYRLDTGKQLMAFDKKVVFATINSEGNLFYASLKDDVIFADDFCYTYSSSGYNYGTFGVIHDFINRLGITS